MSHTMALSITENMRQTVSQFAPTTIGSFELIGSITTLSRKSLGVILKNSPLLVNEAIDRFNSAHEKGERYKFRRAGNQNIRQLVNANPFQCNRCGRKAATQERLDKHMEFHLLE